MYPLTYMLSESSSSSHSGYSHSLTCLQFSVTWGARAHPLAHAQTCFHLVSTCSRCVLMGKASINTWVRLCPWQYNYTPHDVLRRTRCSWSGICCTSAIPAGRAVTGCLLMMTSRQVKEALMCLLGKSNYFPAGKDHFVHWTEFDCIMLGFMSVIRANVKAPGWNTSL